MSLWRPATRQRSPLHAAIFKSVPDIWVMLSAGITRGFQTAHLKHWVSDSLYGRNDGIVRIVIADAGNSGMTDAAWRSRMSASCSISVRAESGVIHQKCFWHKNWQKCLGHVTLTSIVQKMDGPKIEMCTLRCLPMTDADADGRFTILHTDSRVKFHVQCIKPIHSLEESPSFNCWCTSKAQQVGGCLAFATFS